MAGDVRLATALTDSWKEAVPAAARQLVRELHIEWRFSKAMLQRHSMEKGYVLDARKDLRALSSNAIALWGTMDAMYQMQYRHRASGVSAGHRPPPPLPFCRLS